MIGLALTITVCTLMVGSAIGNIVYTEYKYQRSQVPVGFNLE